MSNNLLLWVGRLAGAFGVLVCVVTAGARAAGVWHFGTVSVGTLFNGGVGVMVLGCLGYAASIAERPKR